MKPYAELLRPHQYVKNVFLFLPAFFALRITEWLVIQDTLLGFIGFSLVASSVYILNDYMDRDADRMHPRKKDRPLAAGTVPVNAAFVMFGVCLLGGLGLIFWLDQEAFYWQLGYFIMNVLYTFRLKHIPILDVSIISIGFVIRIMVGGLVVEGHVPISMWIVLMTFLGALFLALAKRRDDVLLAADGREVRKSISGYNLEFINGAMMIMASVLIVSYISYTISEEVQQRFGETLYLTVIFVIIGVLRYMQITFVEEKSGSPTKVLLSDRFVQLTAISWLLLFGLLIY